MMTINASTAMFPGVPLLDAIQLLHEPGLSEPLFSPVSLKHVQLCPQNRTQITEELANELRETYPDTQFRLHANAHVLPQRVIIDASNDARIPENKRYFEQLAKISKILGAPAYSLHAGYATNMDFIDMIWNVRRIEDIFDGTPVAIEGLYPSTRHKHLMKSLLDYEIVYRADMNVALDLSHLKIIAKRGTFDIKVLKDMLESIRTLEIHVSDNDGDHDSHAPLSDEPFWWDTLQSAKLNPDTVIFTEGNQRRP